MKIGVISDIHGNHYALSAVLEESKKVGVEKLLLLGDIVGYYYHPEIVLGLLQDWPLEIIKGNHEVILQDLYENKITPEALREKYGSGHEKALKNLNEKTLQWLFSLPEQKSVVIDNVSFQLNHGSPWSVGEYLYPDTNVTVLQKCNSLAHDFVLLGHSHYAFTFQCPNSVLINCGSVGQSRQKGGAAHWAIIDTRSKCYEIRITPFDVSDLLNEIRLIDSSESYLFKVLSR